MAIAIKLKELENTFQKYSDWEDRYKHIIDMGKTLEAMPEDFKTEENKVKGCQSQVWLFAKDTDDKKIHFYADSDASITKGIIALLVYVYSDESPEEILAINDEFIDVLGLRQHLSMNRANGLNSMVKQIKMYALAYQAKFKAGL